jgi:glutathione synthase/RimK-type ligase-like ATP-grasp enzyme
MFDEMDRRGLSYERIDANRLTYDPSETSPPYSLVVNRMSPSSWLRGGETALFSTPGYLRYLADLGVPVINGHESFGFETSKARQLALMARLGIRHPRGRVITNALDALAAAEALTYPVLVKPNIGGSGGGIVSFDDQAALGAAAAAGELEFGPDHTAIVQEHLPAEGDSVIRVEFLDGRFIYAIRLLLVPGSFNLCPADYCELPGIGEAVADRGAAVEAFDPPSEIIEDARRILDATGADLGGVEYLVNARDGHPYFYDVNALSNFVADAPNVIGFDPFIDLTDFIIERLDSHAAVAI